jgi:23S rRNA (guanosine2251-2'-O)-methyltransferase
MWMPRVIYGRNPVREALEAGEAIEKVILAQGIHGRIIEAIRFQARRRGIRTEEMERRKLEELVGSEHTQGVAAFLSEGRYRELIDILNISRERDEPPLIALLDGIEDPRNLGAIIRSAEGAGVHGVVIPKRRAVSLTETVAKTSAGAVAYMAVAQVSNMAQAIKQLKDEGMWIVGADPEGDEIYYRADLTGPLGIVIGGEGKGMRRLVKEKCDFLVRIPLKGKVTSLNASVAAALLFFEARRQRE